MTPHGRRWTWRRPLRWVCRCGYLDYPCAVERLQAALSRPWGADDPDRSRHEIIEAMSRFDAAVDAQRRARWPR